MWLLRPSSSVCVEEGGEAVRHTGEDPLCLARSFLRPSTERFVHAALGTPAPIFGNCNNIGVVYS